jgi:hypothetical protein
VVHQVCLATTLKVLQTWVLMNRPVLHDVRTSRAGF